MTAFSTSLFFDISDFSYADIFSDTTFVWEALPIIETYIQILFDQKKVTGNYKDRKDVYIGKGTVVHESAEIIGPAIIGDNCTIGHTALLRGGCIIGNSVHVGHAVEIKHSIILNKSAVAHFNYVGDSIVGNEVNIAGGTMVANLRLDKKNITIRSGETYIETGMKKFGAIIGDDSSLGANCVLNPGTVLGKGTIVYPLLSVKGVHNESEIIR